MSSVNRTATSRFIDLRTSLNEQPSYVYVLSFCLFLCAFLFCLFLFGNQYFEDPTSRTPFNVKEEELTGAPFTVIQSADESDVSVTVGVSDANFEINFYTYYEKDRQRRRNAGVEIICPEASFTDVSDFPTTMCGESWSLCMVPRYWPLYQDRTLKGLEKDLEKLEQGTFLCDIYGRRWVFYATY